MTTPPTPKPDVREAARALRRRIDAGERLSLEEARAACVTRDDALTIFERTEDVGEEIFVYCCGERADINGGLFGVRVMCPRCRAVAVEATSPMYSPLLERGSAHITVPTKEWVEAFGDRTWIVTNPGDRP